MGLNKFEPSSGQRTSIYKLAMDEFKLETRDGLQVQSRDVLEPPSAKGEVAEIS